MNPEAQRIAIAEACNLFRIAPLRRTTRKGKPDPNGVVLWYCSEHHGGVATYEKVPDHLNDLNAMHEAEKMLTDRQKKEYAFQLNWYSHVNDLEEAFEIAHATAAQRAEAFLKTIGQWKEEA